MSVFLGDEIEDALNDVLSKMDKIITSSSDLFLKENKQKSVLQTHIQVCLNHSFNDSLKEMIHKVLMDHCIIAEKISPGGFQETLRKIISTIENKHHSQNNNTIHPRFDDLRFIVSKFVNDNNLQNLCIEAIKAAGFGGKITIEKSSNKTTSIEIIDGYCFKHKSIGLQPIKLLKPSVLCIDGYIESVSEINRLFEEAVETKHPLVLITRGMHEDVLHTIKVNKDRKTMFVYPVVINFDLNGINTIVDICVVSGVLPISENSGDLISTTSLKSSGCVDEISIINDSLTIKNKNSKNSVNIHIKNLIEKRSSSNQEIESLLTSRIKSLSNNNVIIRLPDDHNFIKKSQTIDYVLRSIKSMLDYGLVIVDDELNLNATISSSQELSKKFLNQIKNVKAAIC